MWALLALVALQGATVTGTQHFEVENRIVGGENADIMEFPSVLFLEGFVSLNATHQYEYRCGSAILSELWALTGCHCVHELDKSGMTLRAGSTSSEDGGSLHMVDKIVEHENYQEVSGPHGGSYAINDIALIKVSKPFPVNTPGVQAVRLPTQDQDTAPGTTGTILGWGLTLHDGTESTTLLKVDVPVMALEDCKQALAGYSVDSKNLCTTVKEGEKGFCLGDSGGPLFANGQLVGLVSWNRHCGRPGWPDVYTRVAAYRSWIVDKTGIKAS